MKFNIVSEAVSRFGYFTDNVGETDFITVETSLFEDGAITQSTIDVY